MILHIELACVTCNSTYTYFLTFIEIVCSDVPAIGNGTTTIPPRSYSFKYRLGSVATYSCNTGFALVGQTTRVCEDTNGGTMTTGTWSGRAPTCQGDLTGTNSSNYLKCIACQWGLLAHAWAIYRNAEDAVITIQVSTVRRHRMLLHLTLHGLSS